MGGGDGGEEVAYLDVKTPNPTVLWGWGDWKWLWAHGSCWPLLFGHIVLVVSFPIQGTGKAISDCALFHFTVNFSS